MSATHVEKSTVTAGRLNAVSRGAGGVSAAKPASQQVPDLLQAAALAAQSQMALSSNAATDVRFCGVDDPTCEACQ